MSRTENFLSKTKLSRSRTCINCGKICECKCYDPRKDSEPFFCEACMRSIENGSVPQNVMDLLTR